ncbi:MAG: hypothetical protein IT426_15660 [Pirellulales bacterium]|nr:hypothetical protein [Pirellulales bacterium]
MKSYKTILLSATLTWILTEPLRVAAQITNSGGGYSSGAFGYRAVGGLSAPIATTGMFGYRTLGGPSRPITTTGMFGTRTVGGSNFGISSTGMFGNRYLGSALNSYAAGIQNGVGVAAPYSGLMPNSTLPVSNVGGMPSAMEPNANDTNNTAEQPPEQSAERPAAPEATSQPSPTPTGTEGTPPADQGAGSAAPTGMETSAIPSIPYPRGLAFAASALPVRAPTSVRSAELSNRMTRIARDRGMLVGREIEVSIHGDIAVLQGTVHTPGEAVLLATVLSLEPKVRRIDNRLATEGNAANSDR